MGVARKLLATSVASACALPAVALAQVPSSIQIYGRANVTYERITTSNSSNTVVQPNQSNWDLVDNSSRIGFRGNKDLGGGLTGLFQFESRVRLDTGAGVLTGRDSYGGLAGSFGTVRLGRTIGPVYYATYDYISMHNDDKAYTLGGLYDFKTFVVGALIEGAKSNTLVGGDAKRNYFRISGMLPVGKNEFHLNFGTVNHGSGIGGVASGPIANNDGAKQWTDAYNYNITKESKIYGFYTPVHNDTNGIYS